MLCRLLFILTPVLLTSAALAGPCTDRIAEVEKAITAKHEGAGPALSGPTSTGTVQPPSGAADQGSIQAMQMLQRAKEFDRQGRENDCMQVVTAVAATVPTGTR